MSMSNKAIHFELELPSERNSDTSSSGSEKMDAGTNFYYGNENYNDVDTQKAVQTGPDDSISGAASFTAQGTEVAQRSVNPYSYPTTRRDITVVDDFAANIKVVDPYRWLENPDSEETQSFVEEQNHLSESFVDRAGWRDAIRAKMSEMSDFKKTQCPKQFGSRYFYLENSGSQNQAILYVKDSLKDPPRVVMDPNELSEDGLAAISHYSVSPNGEYVAYGLSENGSEWCSIYIKNVTSGQNFLEVLNFTKNPCIQWRNDNKSFFYSRYPKLKPGKMPGRGLDFSVNLNQKVYFHRVGTRQDDDILVAEFSEEPTWTVSSQITADGMYLLFFAGNYVGEQHTYFMDIGRKGAITKGMDKFPLFLEPGQYQYLANNEEKFYFLTNTDAPNCRIISVDLMQSLIKHEWADIVPENPSSTIIWALAVAHEKLAICYNEHLETRLEIRLMASGQLVKAIVFDDNISAWDYTGQRDLTDMFVRVESYLNPGILYQIKVDADDESDTEIYEKLEIPYYDQTIFRSELVFYSNDDGTNVPMTLVYKETTPLNGSACCILAAHGGLGKSLLPEFHVPYVFFAQNFDGVVAIANIRGGSEYGANWWDEGRRLSKVNSIDDFTSAANFLINNKYTKPSRLTIMGKADGATTMAAAVNRHPELFAAAILESGFMDLLRFANFTVGHLWVGEYGNVHKPDELKNIISYSPLHTIGTFTSTSQTYPAVLVTTSDHDDRIVPFHSYKYIAELQHSVGQRGTQENPLMIRIYQNIGHDSKSMPHGKTIEKATDVFCFLENALHYEFHF